MINRLRRSSTLPIGGGNTTGFVALDQDDTYARPAYCVSAADGTRYLDGDQFKLKAATFTATPQDAGKTFGLNHATAIVATLPAAASVPAGKFKFVIAIAATPSHHSVDVVSADTIKGYGASGGGGDAFTLTSYAVGDSITFLSDGVATWYVVDVTTAAIETGDIGDLAITTAKIDDAAVTEAKLEAGLVALLDLLGDLPTENVAAPAIWNHAGVLKVGTDS